MTPDEYREAVDLFERLRDLPKGELSAALDRACGSKADLREQVRRLLAADREVTGESFLNRRAIEDAARMVRSQFVDLPAKGTEVGNYRLGDRIGAGGMGVVYE